MDISIKNNKIFVEPVHAVIRAYSLIATVYCAIFSIVFSVVEKNIFLAVVHFSALIMVVVNYFLIQKAGDLKRAGDVILTAGILVAVSLFATGGWANTGFLWSFTFLPFAFFLTGRSNTQKWMAAFVIGCFVFVALDFLNITKLPYSPVVLMNYFAAVFIFILCMILSNKTVISKSEIPDAGRISEIIRSEQKFKTLVDYGSEIISLMNEDFIPVYCSPSSKDIIGWTFEERVGMGGGIDQTHPDDLDKIKKALSDAVRNPGNKIPISFRTRHKEGHYIWLEGMFVNLLHDENVHAIVANFRDISKRKNSEAQHALYAALVNSSDDAIVSKTMDGIFTSWNKGAENMFGYSSEEVLGKSISKSDYAELFDEEQDIFERIKRHEQVSHFETTCLRKDGTSVALSLTASPIKDAEGNIIGISKIARDITKRKQSEEEINKLNEELRLLLEHVQTSREEERKYIAREIHDELGQTLTALKIDVSMMRRKIETDGTGNPVCLNEELDSVIGKINRTIESVKRIATDLRPEILDHLDIIDALKWQAQQFENITGIQCEVSHLPDHLDLESAFSTTVYRTVQEALTNVTRHANASVVRILIEKDSKKLLIEINDNGKGIKEEDIKSMKSLGLIGMRERVVLLNGTMSITGKPDKGTTVAVKIPIS